jgi:HPt (histidine-containing phosphotransfer) domain-containing protein
MLGLLRQAQTMRDKETLIRTSHTLRGLFGNFAAKPAQKIAHQLEQAALADNFSAIPELLAGLEVEASLLLPLLEKIPPAT